MANRRRWARVEFSLSVSGRNLLDQMREAGGTQAPFGRPRSNGIQQPFQAIAGAGTFSPLLRGRDIGLEVLFAF
jgi:iron complex outermembrane recepter protein